MSCRKKKGGTQHMHLNTVRVRAVMLPKGYKSL